MSWGLFLGRLKAKDLQKRKGASTCYRGEESAAQPQGPALTNNWAPRALGSPRSSLFRERATLSGKRILLYFPSVAGAKEFAEVAAAALGDNVFDLLVHHVFVAREIVPGAKNADGRWEARPMLHVREQEGVGRPRVVRVMHHEIALRETIAERHDFNVAVRFPADTFVAVLAENQRLAMLELHHVLAARIAVGQRKPRPIVEDVAVLENLHKRRAFVCGGVLQRLFEVHLEDVDGACHEGRFRTDGQRHRIEGPVHGPEWRRFGLLVELRGRRVLAFRQTVDLIVEEQDLDADVAPQHMNGVIPADRKRVAIDR